MSGRIYSDKPAQIRYSDKDEDNTEKRFNFKDTVDDEVFFKKRICDDYTNKAYDGTLKDQEDLCKLLNELNDENEQLKQLIHTMLVQIDVEKINTENTRYSARIIFTFEEFKKIQQIWEGDIE